ncbi:hypothetical protein TNCT_649741 [Trichonephila clavata]|uniref:Uncharacterized protein n=1 Tax=Trichonephila clavata TaxID=2740835 RepID=A0A8X6GSC5_TRICU|nr:hypothetical protein TNCT_649741 [Trichonephila clavata]
MRRRYLAPRPSPKPRGKVGFSVRTAPVMLPRRKSNGPPPRKWATTLSECDQRIIEPVRQFSVVALHHLGTGRYTTNPPPLL